MPLLRRLFLVTALLLPAAAPAVSPDAPATMPSEHRLSDAEVERVLAAAAAKRELAEEADDGNDLRIQGEVGVSVGTNGYRSVFGTAVVPVLKGGAAILSFESTDLGKQRLIDQRR